MYRKTVTVTLLFLALFLVGCDQGTNVPREPTGPEGTNILGQAFERGEVPANYSPPWDVLSEDERLQLQLNASLKGNYSQLQVRSEAAPSNESFGLVWKNFYVYHEYMDNPRWEKESFHQQTLEGSNWIRARASRNLTLAQRKLTEHNKTMVVAFTCQVHQGDWKCGCKNSTDCGYWTAQSYEVNNEPPRFNISEVPDTVTVGENAFFKAWAEDPNDDRMNFYTTASEELPGLDLESVNINNVAYFNWTPVSSSVGVHNFTLSAVDESVARARKTFQVEVVPEPNEPPEFVLDQVPDEISVGETVNWTINVADPDNPNGGPYTEIKDIEYETTANESYIDAITSASTGPSYIWFAYTPSASDVGTQSFELFASDGTVNVTTNFSIEVEGLPTGPPELDSGTGGTGGEPGEPEPPQNPG